MSFQYIQQQHLPLSQEYFLFHATTNQSLLCSLVIQPLALHLTMILLGIISWFGIMCGDNLLPSANTANVALTWLFMFFWHFHHHLRITYGDNFLPFASTVHVAVTCLFMLPDILSPPVLHWHCWQYKMKLYWSTLDFWWHLLFGAQCYWSFVKASYMLLKSIKLLLEVCWQLLAKQNSLLKRESDLLHDLELMQHNAVWWGKCFCFIFCHFACNLNTFFYFIF